jgi:poly-gamma-glutamate capsule biosynthesis protein CapA/YwtB (metallophosphatase superfamily)
MTRDQRLMAAFAALATLAVGVVGTGIGLEGSPAVPAESRDVPLGADGRLSVTFVGDTLVGDAAQPLIDQRGIDWPFDAVRPALGADYVLAGAEGPITERTGPWNPGKRYSYSSRPEVASALARAGIDAVTLANNHAFDTGPEGLADTVAHLDAAGIASVGAGADLARAEQPLLLRTALGTVGVVAMGESFGNRAGIETPGTLVMTPESISRGAELARLAGADWVIGFAHWGDNYQPINSQQRAFAQNFADAGYDMVVGSGPHGAQPIEYIGAMPVVYSVGNFVFGTPGRWDTYGVPGRGLALDLELGGPQPRLSVRCLVTDNTVVGFQPRPCSAVEAQAFLPTLNPGLMLQGDVGVLPCGGCFAAPRRAGGPAVPP